jgi:hypothetical protein
MGVQHVPVLFPAGLDGLVDSHLKGVGRLKLPIDQYWSTVHPDYALAGGACAG